MFQVEWIQEALDDLVTFWMDADSTGRQQITSATDEIDARLSANPEAEGESRDENKRITFASPLAVVFRVEEDGKTVSVLQVRLIRGKK